MDMQLTDHQLAMLAGQHGFAARKSMEILTALGTIYGAQGMVPVSSVQVAGVSYDNLGEAGLEFLAEMAQDGHASVLTTLNPAGMDIENWQQLGIPPEFARQQQRVIASFARMGILTTCTCTPYLAGNLPHFGEHIAWAESSAVCYANSVIGARTNREGGPSALAAALTGFTPAYGMHLAANRRPTVTVEVKSPPLNTAGFGALGKVIGQQLETSSQKSIPYITGFSSVSLECLKSFCASIATYGGTALFHMEGITPEASQYAAPTKRITISATDLADSLRSLSDAEPDEIDFVSLGCPHLSIQEIARLAELLKGKKVKKPFWITTARPTRLLADISGYTQIIQESGAIFAVDTCCVVAPIQGRFHALATDSAKACYYAASKHHFKTLIRSFDEVVEEALK